MILRRGLLQVHLMVAHLLSTSTFGVSNCSTLLCNLHACLLAFLTNFASAFLIFRFVILKDYVRLCTLKRVTY